MNIPRRRLFRLIAIVALAHLVLVLAASPALYVGRGETLEETYARGEEALRQQRFAEARQLFRKVMDAQPKPPPIFQRASEQHRLAERLAKQMAAEQGGQPVGSAPRTIPGNVVRSAGPTNSQPTTSPRPATTPESFIPPELRP